MINYTINEIEAMNKTARSKGAVGANAVVPRVVKAIAKPGMGAWILDYGAGPEAIHTKEMLDEGYNIVAWDIGKNHSSDTHLMYFPHRTRFDIVFASNVLNIQGRRYIYSVVEEVKSLLLPGGKAIFNYPNSPRYSNFNIRHIKNILIAEFVLVEQVISIDGLPITPVFVCTKER